ncbi:MAG: HD domain-containing protein [Balneolaceae bacterium]
MAKTTTAYANVGCPIGSKVFTAELSCIKNVKIRNWVTEVLDSDIVPGYFWWTAASTSGKYHPHLSLGPGGLIRHVKYCVYWCKELVRACGFKPQDGFKHEDEVIAAAILHDLIKNGFDYDGSFKKGMNWTPCHGWRLADLLRVKYQSLKNEPWFEKVMWGISAHMGKWGDKDAAKWQNAPNQDCMEVAKLVHLADYCSSRKLSCFENLNKEAQESLEKVKH